LNPQIFHVIKKLSASDMKTLSQKALKTVEEVGELAKKILPYDNAHGTRRNFVTKNGILEEVADSMLCLLSIGYSLGFDNADIGEMMKQKSEKWARLQEAEKSVGELFPFEIHVTVNTDSSDIQNLALFAHACQEMGVKSTILELHDHNHVLQEIDVMTSSQFKGTNSSVLDEVARIESTLKLFGFDITRSKVETIPWHPVAPTISNHRTMPNECYFESHYEIEKSSIAPANVVHVQMIIQQYHAQFSSNERRNGQIMITLRSGNGTREKHDQQHITMIKTLQGVGVVVVKENHEFSIYDTNILHDADWINQGPQVRKLVKRLS
jgi:NTP pyrophosphatase (non-canonical NTP hydrolase)